MPGHPGLRGPDCHSADIVYIYVEVTGYSENIEAIYLPVSVFYEYFIIILVKIMNSRSLLTVAIFGLLLNFAVAEDEEGGAASSGKNEARLLVGKHVRENR